MTSKEQEKPIMLVVEVVKHSADPDGQGSRFKGEVFALSHENAVQVERLEAAGAVVIREQSDSDIVGPASKAPRILWTRDSMRGRLGALGKEGLLDQEIIRFFNDPAPVLPTDCSLADQACDREAERLNKIQADKDATGYAALARIRRPTAMNKALRELQEIKAREAELTKQIARSAKIATSKTKGELEREIGHLRSEISLRVENNWPASAIEQAKAELEQAKAEFAKLIADEGRNAAQSALKQPLADFDIIDAQKDRESAARASAARPFITAAQAAMTEARYEDAIKLAQQIKDALMHKVEWRDIPGKPLQAAWVGGSPGNDSEKSSFPIG